MEKSQNIMKLIVAYFKYVEFDGVYHSFFRSEIPFLN